MLRESMIWLNDTGAQSGLSDELNSQSHNNNPDVDICYTSHRKPQTGNTNPKIK